MRKFHAFILVVIVLLALMAAISAADTNPPLLCDADMLAAKTSVAKFAACPPAPPVCEPAANPYITYSTDSVCRLTVTAAVPSSARSVEIVPIRRKVTVEEVYTVDQKHTIMVDEIRTRTAQRRVAVPGHKIVDVVTIAANPTPSGKSQRLSRGVTTKIKPVTRYETEEYTETYIVPVRTTYSAPVTKTRKVSRYVDDYKVVPKN